MQHKLIKAARLAFLELRGSKAFVLFFSFNLSLGLCGFLALDTLRHSVDTYFQARAKAILGGDLEIEVDNRKFSSEDIGDIRSVLPEGTGERRELHFLTMAASATETRLVDIVAVDEVFPFFPSMTLEKRGLLQPGQAKELAEAAKIWIYPELAFQLGVGIGDEVSLQGRPYKVDDLIVDDAALSSIGLATAPKVYLAISQLAEGGNFQPGSRFEDARYYLLPQGADPAGVEKKIRASARAKDLDIDVYSDSTGRTGRFWDRLGDFLTLVSLVALFLAGVGATYLFRGYLEQRTGDIAILRSLGAEVWFVQLTYMLLLIFLSLLATVGAAAFALVLRPLFPVIFGGLLPSKIDISFPVASIGITLVIAVATSMFVSLPILLRLGRVRPADLFQESGGVGDFHFSLRDSAAFLPAILFYWALAVWQSGSLKIGSAFLGVFAGTVTGLLLLGFLIRQFLPHFDYVSRVSLRLALLNLVRHRLATAMSFLAIGAGVVLTSIVPQVREILHRELMEGTKSTFPSMFMIDIQPGQVGPLTATLAKDGIQFQYLAPMVRARLISVNGRRTADIVENLENPDGSTTDRRRTRRLSREYNLTYSDDLKSSEQIVSGEPFQKQPENTENDEPWQISVEEDFAADAGFRIGDELTFDVIGIEVKGKVVNLRKINWESFHPNFFVKFQSGPLNEAPQSLVATVPPMPSGDRNRLQAKIVKEFPNISMIDITRTAERIIQIAETIALAIGFMALLTMAAGLGVLISIARFNADSRNAQVALLKVLGGEFGTIRGAAVWEFAILGMAAGIGGSILSVGATYAMTVIMFDKLWLFSWKAPLFVLIVTPLICVAAGLWANRFALRARPQVLLSEL